MIASPCKKIGTSRLPDSVKDKKKKVSRSISITNSLLLSRPKCKIVKEDEILKTNIRQSQVVITPS